MTRLRRGCTIAAALLSSASCGSDTISTPGSFLIAITPTTRVTAPGTTTFVTAQVARTGGFNGAVTLTISNTPTGVSASMDPAIVSANVVESRINLTVAPTAPPGTSTIGLTGTAGLREFTATFTLTITPPN